MFQQVRVLAITGERRLSSLPEVPTFKERGHDLTLSLWRGIAAPKGTPEAVIARLVSRYPDAPELKYVRPG